MTAALMGSLIEAVFFLNVLIRVKGLPSALHEKFEVVGRVTDACPFPLRVFPISLPLWSFSLFRKPFAVDSTQALLTSIASSLTGNNTSSGGSSRSSTYYSEGSKIVKR